MANLYANVAQTGAVSDIATCFDMVTAGPAKLMNLKDYGIVVGNPADFVVLDNIDRAMTVAELSQRLTGFKRGRRSFIRPAAMLCRPNAVI